jgi:hypothetical protein
MTTRAMKQIQKVTISFLVNPKDYYIEHAVDPQVDIVMLTKQMLQGHKLFPSGTPITVSCGKVKKIVKL